MFLRNDLGPLSLSELSASDAKIKEITLKMLGNYGLYSKSKISDTPSYHKLEAMNSAFMCTFQLIELLEERALRLESDFEFLRQSASREIKGEGSRNALAELELEIRNNSARIIKLAKLLKKKA